MFFLRFHLLYMKLASSSSRCMIQYSFHARENKTQQIQAIHAGDGGKGTHLCEVLRSNAPFTANLGSSKTTEYEETL